MLRAVSRDRLWDVLKRDVALCINRFTIDSCRDWDVQRDERALVQRIPPHIRSLEQPDARLCHHPLDGSSLCYSIYPLPAKSICNSPIGLDWMEGSPGNQCPRYVSLFSSRRPLSSSTQTNSITIVSSMRLWRLWNAACIMLPSVLPLSNWTEPRRNRRKHRLWLAKGLLGVDRCLW